jgi:protoheme IX farnesyltransferase
MSMQSGVEVMIPADAVGALDAPGAHPLATGVLAQLRAIGRDYLSLTKPRIIVLLVLTEIATMVMAARGIPAPGLLIWAALGGALASGGSGAINCWYDRDIDRVMARTCSRPLPSGRVRPWQALAFGISLIAASVIVFSLTVNLLAAALALGGGLFYVLIYTMVLKRTTSLNIVIGGAAGAFPPLVGWAAVRGDLEWPALALFIIVFLWTPPHFWSLALLLRDDYRNAQIPMLPVLITTAGTHRRILLYLIALFVASLLPGLVFGLGYVIGVGALDACYLALALWAGRQGSSRAAALLFHYSLAYLALVFVVGAVAAL